MWFLAVLGSEKQTQFKAKQTQSYLAPRIFWGLKTKLKKQSQFKPNFVRVSDCFVIACIVMEESRAFPVTGNFV